MKSILLSVLLLLVVTGCAPGPAFANQTISDRNEKPQTSACYARNDAKNLCLKIFWLVGPALKQENKIQWTVTTLDQETPVSFSNTPVVELWMPDMGHGSSPTETLLQGAYYQTQRMYFIMPGTWVMRFYDAQEVVFEVSLIL